MEDIIFNSYLVGEERELAIEESAMDVLFADLNMKYEMVNMQLEYDKKAAEYKVFSEGGTYDDFLYLLEEANEEANTAKKGILRTIIDAIKKILNKIGEKLSSIGKNPGDPNEDVEIDEGVDKTQKALDSVASDINSAIDTMNAAQEGNYLGAAQSALSAFSGKSKIGAALTATGIGVATGVMIKIKRGKAAKDAKKNESLLNKITNLMKKHENDENNNNDQNSDKKDGGFIDTLKQAFEAIKNTVIKVINFIAEGLSKIWHGAANKMFGKWKEVPEGTKGAKKCVTDNVDPGKDEVQMGEINKNLADGQSEAVEGHWYIKETEGGTKAREGKEEKSEQSKWKKAEGNDLNSADCYLVVPDSVTPKGKQKTISEAEKLVPGIKVNESIISTDASKKAAGFEVSITPEELAKVAGISDSEYKNLTKNDNERGKIEKIKNWFTNKQFTSDQLNQMADHIWERVGKHKELASQAQWGMDSKSWNAIPEPVQRIIKDRVNKSKGSANNKQQNNNNTANQTNNAQNQSQQQNNTNNNNSNGNEQNTNESVVDELLINPFVDYISESDDYNMEISEIADMIASL